MSLTDADLAEHLSRARFFLDQSKTEKDATRKSWFVLATVYPSRAVVEVMIDRLRRGMLKGEFEDFLTKAAEQVQYFKVIEYLRVQDFHRRAVRFAPGRLGMFGPIKLGTGNSPGGAATVSGAFGEAMHADTAKTGYVKQDRPVQIRDFEIYVEQEGWASIDRVLAVYLDQLEAFILAFLQAHTSS